MPFYIIDTQLSLPAAPANLDPGGIGALVYDQPYPTRDAAEAAVQRLRQRRKLGWQQFHERAQRRRAAQLQRFPATPPDPDPYHELKLAVESVRETTIVEAAGANEALRLAETEAYRRLGQSLPTTYQYFALAMRSVSNDDELLDKRVEIIAGPCASREELRSVLASGPTAMDSATGADSSETLRALKARWPTANSSASRRYIIKAANREHALCGEGIECAEIIPSEGRQVSA